MNTLVLLLLGFSVVLAEESEVLRSFTLTNNQFSADIYRQIKTTYNDNFVVCPLSAEVLLALIYADTDGVTALELSKALRLPQKKEDIYDIYREVHPKFQSSQNYTLRSANRIYVKNNYNVQEQYKNITTDVFGASIQNIDFDNALSAASQINNWVAQTTENKITKLISDTDIDGDTRAILVNAIYFKGKWVNGFKKHATRSKPFYLTEENYTKVDTMEQTDYFRYYNSSELNAQFIELPYEGDDVTMTIVLPHDKEGLSALEEHIHEAVVVPQYTWEHVNLRLPKNEIKTSIQFKPVLQNLGVLKAFEPSYDFNQMLTATDEALYISKVVQSALIETNEEGTVAAAATAGIVANFYSLQEPVSPPIQFHADHPFIFYLNHKDFGIFFIGRYSKPDGEILRNKFTRFG